MKNRGALIACILIAALAGVGVILMIPGQFNGDGENMPLLVGLGVTALCAGGLGLYLSKQSV